LSYNPHKLAEETVSPLLPNFPLILYGRCVKSA